MMIQQSLFLLLVLLLLLIRLSVTMRFPGSKPLAFLSIWLINFFELKVVPCVVYICQLNEFVAGFTENQFETFHPTGPQLKSGNLWSLMVQIEPLVLGNGDAQNTRVGIKFVAYFLSCLICYLCICLYTFCWQIFWEQVAT